MFVELFFKECRQIFKSLIYFIIVAFIVIFYFTQFETIGGVEKPKSGLESYGLKYSDDKSIIMRESLKKLEYEYDVNAYTAYPIGFYKQVILKDENQSKIKKIIDEIKLLPENEASYESFEKLMKMADNIIGGGSFYSDKMLRMNAEVPVTYEEALQEYDDLLNKDRITNASARLFCDYMGIILAILPVFLAVTRCLRDRRSMADGVIFAKKSSSAVIILSRYLANIAMLLLPLIIIAVFPTLECSYVGDIVKINADNFAFYKHIFGWLLPSILISTSIGFFVTELTNSALAILIQGGWWLVSVFASFGNLVGNVGMNLIPRFNKEGCYYIFESIFNELVFNRIFYSILAIFLIIVTVFIYEAKRKGKYNVYGKIFKNKQNQL